MGCPIKVTAEVAKPSHKKNKNTHKPLEQRLFLRDSKIQKSGKDAPGLTPGGFGFLPPLCPCFRRSRASGPKVQIPPVAQKGGGVPFFRPHGHLKPQSRRCSPKKKKRTRRCGQKKASGTTAQPLPPAESKRKPTAITYNSRHARDRPFSGPLVARG